MRSVSAGETSPCPLIQQLLSERGIIMWVLLLLVVRMAEQLLLKEGTWTDVGWRQSHCFFCCFSPENKGTALQWEGLAGERGSGQAARSGVGPPKRQGHVPRVCCLQEDRCRNDVPRQMRVRNAGGFAAAIGSGALIRRHLAVPRR